MTHMILVKPTASRYKDDDPSCPVQFYSRSTILHVKENCCQLSTSIHNIGLYCFSNMMAWGAISDVSAAGLLVLCAAVAPQGHWSSGVPLDGLLTPQPPVDLWEHLVNLRLQAIP